MSSLVLLRSPLLPERGRSASGSLPAASEQSAPISYKPRSTDRPPTSRLRRRSWRGGSLRATETAARNRVAEARMRCARRRRFEASPQGAGVAPPWIEGGRNCDRIPSSLSV